MHYFVYDSSRHIGTNLDPKDWTPDEWKTILKLFGLKEAERVVFADYKLRAWGTPTPKLAERIWPKCDFCQYDIGPRRKSHEQCKSCFAHSEFQLKKRMHERQKHEWELYCEFTKGE